MTIAANAPMVELGDVRFDVKLLAADLKQDLRDDWFPDPLRFADMIDNRLIDRHLQTAFADNHGRYVPLERHVFNLPKSNFTLRYALETGLADRAVYQGLARFLLPFYDPLIPWNAFSHRLPRNAGQLATFQVGVDAWKEFVGCVRSALSPTACLLTTDLANYFEYIDLQRLKDLTLSLMPELKATALQKAQIRARIDLLFSCLDRWAFEPGRGGAGGRGLPQNRDASSFLANLYMLPVDRAMISGGYGDVYFRYMDDIKIVCRNRFHARKALKDLSIALRGVGLTVNSKKTALIELTRTDQGELNDHLNDGDPEVQALDQMFKSRTREVLLRAIPRLRELALKLIHDRRVDSREFRFCIRRLERLALCDDFHVPDEVFEDITTAMTDALEEHPVVTDQIVTFLAAVPMKQQQLERVAEYMSAPERAIYSWQNYRLWCLLARKGFVNDHFLQRAVAVAATGPDTPTRAGASLYAGMHGQGDHRASIAREFKSLDSFIGQRSALIAVHELHYRPTIESFVQPHIRRDLVGVFRALRAQPGSYFSKPERLPIADLINVDRDYYE